MPLEACSFTMRLELWNFYKTAPFHGSKCAQMGTTQSEQHMGIRERNGAWGGKASDEM
jgi:hypothetical protein